MRTLLIALGITIVMTLGGTAAGAQGPSCAPRDVLLQKLERGYDEKPVAGGVSKQGTLVEVLVSPSGSWSIVITIPNGPSCLVSTGDGWRDLKPAAPDDPLA